MGMPFKHTPIRGSSISEANAYLDLVAAGCGHAVVFNGPDCRPAALWLSERGIRFHRSLGVFGFRKREDADLFAAHFSPMTRFR